MTCIDGNKHLELALPVLKAGKPLFIDKPFAASLTDAFAIAKAAKKYNVPMFSSSSLRYMEGLDKIQEDAGKIFGAETYSASHREESHPDLFWYGVHGIEILFSIMGVGCQSVKRTTTENADYVVGVWEGDRIGTYRGIRHGKTGYGATVFGEKGIKVLNNYAGYEPLLVKITEFYDSKVAPFPMDETLEIFAFMEAAEESKKKGGIAIDMVSLMKNKNK
jgi:predicted dehydrogenase